MVRNNVDLPIPFTPSKATISPPVAEKLMDEKTICFSLYPTLMFSPVSMGYIFRCFKIIQTTTGAPSNDVIAFTGNT